MTTLTDRYVWGVLRAVPSAQRVELEPEIRALVADAIEARADDPDPASAERAALVELGDPEVLASRYTDRSLALIGPRVFLDWKRVLMTLVPIVVPIVATVVGAAELLSGAMLVEALLSALATAFMVGVQLAFWVTVAFAFIERSQAPVPTMTGHAWTVDDLPAVPAAQRIGLGELVGSLVANALVAVVIVWQQLRPPIEIDGVPAPLFDPALWSFWLPWFLVVTLLEMAFAIVLYLRGRWTWALALGNAFLGAAFAIPAIYLVQNGLLLNPDVAEAIQTAGGRWLDVTVTITAIVIAIIVAWDAIDGFRKAWLNSRPERATTAA